MTKIQFILALRDKLEKLPREDREKALEYYNELIDDRIEDGLSEAEAVAAVGSVEEIAEQILTDIPMTKLVKENIGRKKPETWVIVLLIAGAPLWLSLLASAFSVVVSAYASALAVVVSLFATAVAVGACAPVMILLGVQILINQGFAVALVYWGIALVAAGLAVFFWIGGHYTAKGCIWVSKKFWLWVKSLFLRKGDAQ